MVSFHSSVRHVLRVTWALGLIPSSNVAGEIRFRWRSLPVLYSFVFNGILLALNLECAYNMMGQVAASTKGSVTDSLSNGGFLFLQIGTKYLVTFLTILKTPRIIAFIKLIAQNDIRFNHTNKVSLMRNLSIILIFVGGILGVGGLRSYLKTTEGQVECWGTRLFNTPIIPLLPLAIFEVNFSLVIALIVIFTIAIRERILAILKEFQNLAQGFSLPFPQVASSKMNAGQDLKFEVSLKSEEVSSLINRLGSVVQLKERFEEALSLIIFAIVSSGILQMILFVYLVLISIKDSLDDSLVELLNGLLPLLSSGLINISRLIILCQAGHYLSYSVVELRNGVKTLDATALPKSASEKVSYLQELVCQLRFEVSAAGYFVLNRAFLSSLVGPVITFVVVIAQFRMSDFDPSQSPKPGPSSKI